MRLLIYLLAMMTGFSAAEAARPVSATPAAVAQRAVAAVSVVSVEQKLASAVFDQRSHLAEVAFPIATPTILVSANSPVSRHDLTQQ